MAAPSGDTSQGWRVTKRETVRSQSFGDMKSFFKGPEEPAVQWDPANSGSSNFGGGSVAPPVQYHAAPASHGGAGGRKPRSTSYDNVVAQVAAVAEEDEDQDDGDSLPGADTDGHNDDAQFWQSDTEARGCSVPGCRKRFTFRERRHHCRKCGLAVCAACSNGRMVLADPAAGNGDSSSSSKSKGLQQRVCTKCIEALGGSNSGATGGAGFRRKSSTGSNNSNRGGWGTGGSESESSRGCEGGWAGSDEDMDSSSLTDKSGHSSAVTSPTLTGVKNTAATSINSNNICSALDTSPLALNPSHVSPTQSPLVPPTILRHSPPHHRTSQSKPPPSTILAPTSLARHAPTPPTQHGHQSPPSHLNLRSCSPRLNDMPAPSISVPPMAREASGGGGGVGAGGGSPASPSVRSSGLRWATDGVGGLGGGGLGGTRGGRVKSSNSMTGMAGLLKNMGRWSSEWGGGGEDSPQMPSSPTKGLVGGGGGGAWAAAMSGSRERERERESAKDRAAGGVVSMYNGGLHVQTDDSRAVEGMKLEQMGHSTRPTVLPKPGTCFEWGGGHTMDHQGVLYFLATCGGSKRWQNPADTGIVKVHGSGWLKGRIQEVANSYMHAKSDSWSQDAPGAWFSITLPPTLQIEMTHYSLRHGYGGGAQMRNWELLVSIDGETWTTVRRHVNDTSLSGGYGIHTWTLTPHAHSARSFKIVATGGNSIDGKQLACAGFEVYGRVVAQQCEGVLNPSHWLFSDSVTGRAD